MAVIPDLTEEERYLLAILQDQSGIDGAELCWVDERSPDSVFRCRDYQYNWWRDDSKLQIDQSGRSLGKSLGISLRAWAFPFTNAGEEMLLTAPEMIHLDPVTQNVESRLMSTRLSRELLDTSGNSRGFTHRPFEARFRNGAKIIGRIPQKDGRGVKGMHPKKLEMDESSDYPEAGWVELTETLTYGAKDAVWRAHGVSKGIRDRFYKYTQPDSGWRVHRITAMHRDDWSAEQRETKAEMYGSRDHPDYRRNIIGLHGDAQSALFVLSRLMACVDDDRTSRYNAEEYTFIKISEETVKEFGIPIREMLNLPGSHQSYDKIYIGMDVGITNHPSEIVVFGVDVRRAGPGVTGGKLSGKELPKESLKLLARIHLDRIGTLDQFFVIKTLYDFYRPQAFGMDSTGLGLPIYQIIMDERAEYYSSGLAKCFRGYNFSSNIVVGYEPIEDSDEVDPEFPLGKPMEGNVLQYSSDVLRLLVDQGKLLLPWDVDLLREFQGQTYAISRSTMDAYGRKIFNKGKFHALDACRMAALCYQQKDVESLREIVDSNPVLDSFVMF